MISQYLDIDKVSISTRRTPKQDENAIVIVDEADEWVALNALRYEGR